MFKKIVSFILCLCMMFMLTPTVLAAEAEEVIPSESVEVIAQPEETEYTAETEETEDEVPAVETENEIPAEAAENEETAYSRSSATAGGVTVEGLLPAGAGVDVKPVAISAAKSPLRKSMAKASNASGDSLNLNNIVAAYDIKLTLGDEEVQPDGMVTITLRDLPLTGNGKVTVHHYLDSEQAIIEGIRRGTAEAVTDARIVGNSAFASALEAAEKATGMTGTVYMETIIPEVYGTTITFETGSFSIYVIEEDGEIITYRRTYQFQNPDGTPYEFLNDAGQTVHEQIMKNGDYLQDVGTPHIASNQTFLGWYVYDTAAGSYTETQILFGAGNEIDDITQDETVTVRARCGTAYYVTFYENVKGTVIYQRKQAVVDESTGTATYNINAQTMASPDAELALVGWSYEMNQQDPVNYDTDNRPLIPDGLITLTGDIFVYPVFKSAHWITFYTAPAGSGATYIAPAFVLAGHTAADKEPEDPVWTGYTFQGWYTEPDGGELFDFDQMLNQDVTIYAHWIDATARYTVVYWRQKVTDAVDAADAVKTYDYVTSEERYATKGVTVYPTTTDKVSSAATVGSDVDITGFRCNENLTTASVTVEADGSSVINIYFDRNAYTLAFTVAGTSYQDYVIATDNNGTQYAYVNGEYVQLVREESTVYGYRQRYTYTSTTSNANITEYGIVDGEYVQLTRAGNALNRYWTYNGQRFYGTRYTRANNNGQYNYSGLRYLRSGNNPYTYTETTGDTGTQYCVDSNGGYVELQRNNGTTVYTWLLNGTPYTGTRYKYQNTQSHIVRHIVALYGQSVSQYFPIEGYDGTSYNGYQWSDTGNPQTYSQVLQTVETMPAANVTFNGTYRGTAKTVYYYVQVVDGEDLTGVTTRNFNGRTYKYYKEVQHDFNYITFNEEYHPIEGFDRDRTWAEPAFGTNNQASIGTGNVNYLYYNRKTYELNFIDSANNDVLRTDTPQFEAPLSGYEPNWTPTSTLPGYKFKGWFKDASCTDLFDFSANMPASNVAVYAGWEEIWYRVEIDPNGGQLTSGESTFFWTGYGTFVEEYADVTRDYVLDPDGTFYYLYHPYSAFVEFDQNGNNWYSNPNYYAYWDRIAHYSESTLVNNYSDYNSETGQYDTTTQVEDPFSNLTVKYRYDKGAYALVGWYRVNPNGTLGEVYNFNTEVTSDLKLRAVWRKVGEYRVRYATSGYVMDGDGNLTLDSTVVGADNPVDGNNYADNSASSMLPRLIAPSGYVFTGWYYDGVIYQPGDVYNINADLAETVGEYKVTTIYPVFTAIENLPVQVTTVTLDGNGGTFNALPAGFDAISLDNINVYAFDLPLNSAVILPDGTYLSHPGYTFQGWSLTSGDNNSSNFQAGSTIGMDNFDRESNPNDNILYAVWQENIAEIDYQIVGPAGAIDSVGSLNNYEENVLVATGTPQGSLATESNTAYKFVGWYTDEECTQSVDASWLTEDGYKITPQKNSDGIYESATYYAKFTSNTCTLTITNIGDMAAGEGGIYIVTGAGLPAGGLKISVPAGESVTIGGVYIGETYTIAEQHSWSWRYTESDESIALQADNTLNTVEIDNVKQIAKWLNGCSWAWNRKED